MNWFISGLIGLVLAGVLWLVWLDGKNAPGGTLFHTPNAAVEAGYCLAVAERAREITRGQADRKLEGFITESIDFWRGRLGQGAVQGQAALGRDLAKPGVNEGAHLHLAIQACGRRAVALYGHSFASMG